MRRDAHTDSQHCLPALSGPQTLTSPSVRLEPSELSQTASGNVSRRGLVSSTTLRSVHRNKPLHTQTQGQGRQQISQSSQFFESALISSSRPGFPSWGFGSSTSVLLTYTLKRKEPIANIDILACRNPTVTHHPFQLSRTDLHMLLLHLHRRNSFRPIPSSDSNVFRNATSKSHKA